MRKMRAVVAVAVILVIGGCSSNNKGKIEGTKWTSIAMTVKGKQLPAGALKIEFKADGTFSYSAGPTVMTGTYKPGSGDKVTMVFSQPINGRTTNYQTIKIDGDTMQMIDSDGTTGTFKKAS